MEVSKLDLCIGSVNSIDIQIAQKTRIFLLKLYQFIQITSV